MRLICSLPHGMSVEAICKKVKDDIALFVGEAEKFDDITMLCVRLNEVENMKISTNPIMESIQWMLTNICNPVETLFISALMCITAPAVFISITCSMFKFEGLTELGENGKRVITCYILLAIIATFVGILSFQLFTPGEAGILSNYCIAYENCTVRRLLLNHTCDF